VAVGVAFGNAILAGLFLAGAVAVCVGDGVDDKAGASVREGRIWLLRKVATPAANQVVPFDAGGPPPWQAASNRIAMSSKRNGGEIRLNMILPPGSLDRRLFSVVSTQ
jgi:hypothetical protein